GAWRPPEPVAAALLDAPCSATGTLRRHPDIARLKGPGEIPSLAVLQNRLLAAAAEMLAPGGRLIYAVCSLLPEEGPARIAALLETGAPLVREPIAAPEIAGEIAAEIAGLGELITPEGDLRSLPSQLPDLGGLDGFYVCRLRRL
ncbi:MAG: MFS transporter, partial [Kiloniellales bacterium]|nr:MFS transporter [Kiloniellales bacterium]